VSRTGKYSRGGITRKGSEGQLLGPALIAITGTLLLRHRPLTGMCPESRQSYAVSHGRGTKPLGNVKDRQ